MRLTFAFPCLLLAACSSNIAPVSATVEGEESSSTAGPPLPSEQSSSTTADTSDTGSEATEAGSSGGSDKCGNGIVEQPRAEEALVERAKTGVAGAFDALSQPYVGMLHKLAYRLVNHPDDAEDLVQESLLQAFRKLDSFRGEAKFSTWLLSIATRKCIDHLRKKKRWPLTCQDTGARHHNDSPAMMSKLEEIAATPGFRYEYREHIAYCFACVGRSLDAEQSAALVLREVLELSNGEAAKVLGLSLSTFRHRLSSARKFMMAEFEGRCALVGKQGVCWQCEALRKALPETVRGEVAQAMAQLEDDAETKLRKRLVIVRDAKLGSGTTGALHAYIQRYMGDTFD